MSVSRGVRLSAWTVRSGYDVGQTTAFRCLYNSTTSLVQHNLFYNWAENEKSYFFLHNAQFVMSCFCHSWWTKHINNSELLVCLVWWGAKPLSTLSTSWYINFHFSRKFNYGVSLCYCNLYHKSIIEGIWADNWTMWSLALDLIA